MSVVFDFPNKAAPTITLTFNPTLVSITRKRPAPIQQIELAVSGRAYVRQLSSNVEETWEIDFEDLHEADSGGNAGFTSLDTFIRTTINFHQASFEVTDDDGDSLICRYISGLPGIEESGGPQRRQGRKGRFTGTLTVLKVL